MVSHDTEVVRSDNPLETPTPCEPMNSISESIPRSELIHRIERLQQRLRDDSMDAAMVLQNVDRFYFAGTIQQGQLYIPAQGAPILFIRKSAERARSESALDEVVPIKSPRRIPGLLQDRGLPAPATLGMELDVLPVNLYRTFQELFDGCRITDVSPAIRRVRSVKSAYEIERIRKATELADALLGRVGDMIEAGMTEMDLAGRVEGEARRMGHQGIVRMRLWGSEVFYGHLMAGPGAAVPSFLASPTGGVGPGPAVAQGASMAVIQRHQPILVDYTFAVDGYLSDQTRIFSLGRLPAALRDGYAAMVTVQETVKDAARAGVQAGEVYEKALNQAESLGVGDRFMGSGPDRIRFVGHGVGLELDELPFLAHGQKTLLEAGMTVAVEPKLIIPDVGVVGIENTHLVTGDGLETLNRFPDEIIEI